MKLKQEWTHAARKVSNMSELPEWVDRRLRIELFSGETLYIWGSSHTFRGRFAAWHPDGFSLSVSKYEVRDCSTEASMWIEGFIRGSEPHPPISGEERATEAWEAAVKVYRETGDMPRTEELGWWQRIRSRLQRR